VNGDPTIVAYSDGGDFVNEELEDVADATSPMYDQLSASLAWWILEVIPQPLRYQNNDDEWINEYTCATSSSCSMAMILTYWKG
jgi:hypothetical protein